MLNMTTDKQREYAREYYARNKDRIKLSAKKYRSSDKGIRKKREYSKEYQKSEKYKEYLHGYRLKNKDAISQYRKDYREKTGNASTHKYEKTPRGFLMRLYRNMQSRVTGVQKAKYHLYKNKSLLSREEFYVWTSTQPKFEELFRAWKESGYDQKLTPTVDRVNSKEGYKTENMEWITHSENSRRGSENSRKDKNNE